MHRPTYGTIPKCFQLEKPHRHFQVWNSESTSFNKSGMKFQKNSRWKRFLNDTFYSWFPANIPLRRTVEASWKCIYQPSLSFYRKINIDELHVKRKIHKTLLWAAEFNPLGDDANEGDNVFSIFLKEGISAELIGKREREDLHEGDRVRIWELNSDKSRQHPGYFLIPHLSKKQAYLWSKSFPVWHSPYLLK